MPQLTQTVGLTLEERLENRARLAAMKTEIEKQLDAENASIKEMLYDLPEQRFETDDYTATVTVSSRQTLDKMKLIEQGVTTDQIKAATTTSVFDKLDVRKKKKVE